MARKKLSFDQDRFLRVLKAVEKAVVEEKGFFWGDWRRRYLPEWNLPEVMEHDPRRREVANPREAARWIFTRVSLDRLSLSTRLGELARKAWEDEGTRWLFDPHEVVRGSIATVEDALAYCFNHALPVTPEMSAGEGYWNNAQVMMDQYGGDVRNVVEGASVRRVIKRLERLDGFGPGLSRLLITELHGRRIVSPTDAEKLENKIDRHKAAIPLNTEAVTTSGDFVHMYTIGRFLQSRYTMAFRRIGIPPEDIDAAMWIIGSKGCVRQDMYHCKTYCPLSPAASGLCVRAASLGNASGTFVLVEDGKPVDKRRPNPQTPLDFTGVQGLKYDV